jgi:uncharacterized membrane protein YbhN (UPF0104 family)
MTESTEDAPSTSVGRVVVRVIVQMAALVAVGWIAYRYFDFEQVKLAFESLSLQSIGIFVGLMLVVRLINSWRWMVICRQCLDIDGVSLWFMTRVTLLAQFTNVWFPSFIGGEVVRVWKVSRIDGMSTEIPISVMLDRVVGVASLGVLCIPFLFLFPHFLPDINRALQNPWLLWGGLGFAGLLVGAVLWKRRQFLNLARRSWGFFVDNNYLVQPMLISMLGYSVIVAAYMYLLQTLDAGSFLDISAVTLIPRFGRVFPVSALGVGAVEGGTFVVGKYLGIGSQVLVVIVAVHITSKYVASLLGALLELGYEGRNSLQELLEQTSNPEAPTESPDTRN